MADQKISELTALTTPNQKDLFVIIDDPTGTPLSKSISYFNLFGGVVANTTFQERVTHQSNVTVTGATVNCNANLEIRGSLKLTLPNTVATNTATGAQGTFQYDEGFLYICYGTNKWKRVAVSDF